MKKVILKINNENIIEDIGESYNNIPSGYKEYLFENYPNDLSTRTYKLINGKIVRDEILYAKFLEEQENDSIDSTETLPI